MAFPFYSVSASGHGEQPFGVHPGGVGVHPGIPHARGLAKNRAPFHPLLQVFHCQAVGSNNREDVYIKG